MEYHLAGFILGIVLDFIFGDPYWLPHPVRFIGRLITFCEKCFFQNDDVHRGDSSLSCSEDKRGSVKATNGNRGDSSLYSSSVKRRKGCYTVIIVCSVCVILSGVILGGAYLVNPVLGCIVESIMTYQLLAAKCLKVESMKVYNALEHKTIEQARKAVSMIVGRDTQQLTDEQVTKAAVETIAENTSDGVIAPMLFTALGGPVLGFLYKAVNTMDSMIGYKNEKYFDFGRCAAKTDDVLNFIPARLSALLMIFICLFLGKKYSLKNAWTIFKRDRYNHQSPNSAQTESACAGALGIQLAGPACYGGVVEDKPFLGDPQRTVEHDDIKRANVLMYGTTLLCAGLCVIIMVGCCYAWR